MRVMLLAADSAQMDTSGKAHALGLGWSLTSSPTAAMSLILLMELEAGEQVLDRYSVTGSLLNAQGLQQETSNGQAIGFTLTMEATVGDDRVTKGSVRSGAPERLVTTIPIPGGLRLESGRYDWVVEVEEPPTTASFGFGVVKHPE
ncbi:hypothetical protein ACWEKT_11605 [Nocardia takedensis]